MSQVDYVEHIYGRDITYRWVPVVRQEEIEAVALVSARLYSQAPTTAQLTDTSAVLTTNLAGSTTTWTNEGGFERKMVFSALTDATPTSSTEYERYYVVVNYTAQASAQQLVNRESIFVWRPDAMPGRARVEPSDIYDLERVIQEITNGDSYVQPKIKIAEKYVYSKLKSAGYDKRRMFRPEELKDCIVRKALVYICRDLAAENNQFWLEKAAAYEAEFLELYSLADVGYDEDDDPSVPTQAVGIGTHWVLR